MDLVLEVIWPHCRYRCRYDMKGGMFASTLYTQVRVDWSCGEIYVPEIKEGFIKSLKPWQLGGKRQVNYVVSFQNL